MVKFDGPDNEQRGNLHETAHNCIQGGSIGVKMVERLRHRLAERGGNILGLYSSVFSFGLNRTTASIYSSYAWDETSEHVCLVRTLDMRNERSQRECERLISNILFWGTTTRLGGHSESYRDHSQL